MWTFTTIASHDYENKNAVSCRYNAPIRGDGSRHWIEAEWEYTEIYQACKYMDSDFADYIRYSEGFAGKHSMNNVVMMQQFDPPAVTGGRNIFMSLELSNLQRVHEICKNKLKPNAFSYLLYKKELLTKPTADEAKRICTTVREI